MSKEYIQVGIIKHEEIYIVRPESEPGSMREMEFNKRKWGIQEYIKEAEIYHKAVDLLSEKFR